MTTDKKLKRRELQEMIFAREATIRRLRDEERLGWQWVSWVMRDLNMLEHFATSDGVHVVGWKEVLDLIDHYGKTKSEVRGPLCDVIPPQTPGVVA